jgi:hypothetical protein
MFSLGMDLVSGECLFFVVFWVFLSLVSSSLLSTGYLGLGGFQGLHLFLFSSAHFNWLVNIVWNALGQRWSVGTGFAPMACVAFGLTLRT